tara:strand:+ start:10 stop:156 length:147 start_codon:yes stop_codon:yes gene_type:complete
MKKEYKIIGIYNGEKEEIDTAKNKKEAIYLMNEYKLSFGNNWIIKIKK